MINGMDPFHDFSPWISPDMVLNICPDMFKMKAYIITFNEILLHLCFFKNIFLIYK